MSVNPSTTQLAPDCEALTQLIPDYAFGLTDADETRLVERNLARCPEAAALLEDYRALQSELRESVPEIEPAPELGARLMAAVRADATSDTMTLRTPPSHEPSKPQVADAPVTRVAPRRISRTAWLVAAAAVIALVLTNAYWFSRVDSLSSRLDTLAAAQSTAQNAFVLNNTDALHWVRLAGTEDAADASAFMMWNTESQTGLLYARGFPEPPSGFGYQLWLANDDGRISGGVFGVDPTGDGALLFHIDKPIDGFTRAGITTEPVSGSDGPTSPAVVRGEL